MRFYADKARRHYLPDEQHKILVAEIDRMIEKAGDYSFSGMQRADRGWIFCPEYAGDRPLEVSPTDWETRVFLFGPSMLPDSELWRGSTIDSSGGDWQHQLILTFRGKAEPQESVRPDTPEGAHPMMDLPEESTTSTSNTPEVVVSENPSLSLGADILTGTEVRWPLTVKGNPHLLIAGLPGMGKTTCLLNLCNQMQAVGVRPIVFSYHPDFDERLKSFVPSIRFVDFQGLGFNPLQVLDRQSRMAYLDVAGALRDIFAAIFPELGDIQLERVAQGDQG